MRRSSPLSGKPFALGGVLHHQLNMYAVAASAAGVGMLALAQTAEARIVYTATHQVIHRGGQISLDLNHDGVIDFIIAHGSGCSSSGCAAGLNVNGRMYGDGNYVEGLREIFDYAFALRANQKVGSTKPFMGQILYNRSYTRGTSGRCRGAWVNVKNRYLGFRFVFKHATHFGWARLNVACDAHAKKVGVLTGYAYETKPNTPIITGKTAGSDVIFLQTNSSLGHLAVGASAITANPHTSSMRNKTSPMENAFRSPIRH
jgi:hypothetical protein